MNTEQRKVTETTPSTTERRAPVSEFAGQEKKVFSIERYMRDALAAMQARLGWFKENPAANRAREAAEAYPDVEAAIDTQLHSVEQRAEAALQNASHAVTEVVVEHDTEASTELHARGVNPDDPTELELNAIEPIEDIPAVEVHPDAPTEQLDRSLIAGAPQRTSFDIARSQVEIPVEISWRFDQTIFQSPQSFETHYRMFENATRVDMNTVAEDQRALAQEKSREAQQIMDAMRAIGSRMGYAEKGSYLYFVDSYKNIEGNLPRINEAMQSVQEIIAQEQEAAQDSTTFERELAYLKHLRARAEHSPRNRMHRQVERFIAQNQGSLKEEDMRTLSAVDSYVDSADDTAFAQGIVNEAIDTPARTVLCLQVDAFKADYGDFLLPADIAGLDARAEHIAKHDGPIVYGAQRVDLQQHEYTLLKKLWPTYINGARRRVDAFGARYGESLTKTDREYIALAIGRLADAQQPRSPRRADSLKEFMQGIDTLLNDIDRRHRPRKVETRPRVPASEAPTDHMAAAAK